MLLRELLTLFLGLIKAFICFPFLLGFSLFKFVWSSAEAGTLHCLLPKQELPHRLQIGEGTQESLLRFMTLSLMKLLLFFLMQTCKNMQCLLPNLFKQQAQTNYSNQAQTNGPLFASCTTKFMNNLFKQRYQVYNGCAAQFNASSKAHEDR